MKQLKLIRNKSLIISNTNKIPRIRKNECLVKVHFCGICSSDIPRIFDSQAYFYPIILGHEIAGEIYQTGNLIKKFKVGDKVSIFPLIPCNKCNFCKESEYNKCLNYKYYGSRNNGGFCEYIIVREWNLIKIHKDISLKDACLLEPMSVCVHAIRLLRKNLSKKETNLLNKKVLIIGSGFLGLIILNILSNFYNYTNITIVDKNEFKLKYTKNINCKNLLKKKFIEDKNNLEKFDIIFEATGNSLSFIESIKYATRNAVILWLGNINKNLIIPKEIVSSLLRKELTIIGSWNSNFKKKKDDDWNISLKYLNEKFKPSKFISHEIKLEKVEEHAKKIFLHKKGRKEFKHLKTIIKF